VIGARESERRKGLQGLEAQRASRRPSVGFRLKSGAGGIVMARVVWSEPAQPAAICLSVCITLDPCLVCSAFNMAGLVCSA
jgi:hypothetical protein